MSCLEFGSDTRYRDGSQTEEVINNINNNLINTTNQQNIQIKNESTTTTSNNYKNRRRRRKRLQRQQQRQEKSQTTHHIVRPRQYDNEDLTWGDELTIDHNWMESNDEGKLRITHLNTNGITSKNEYIEWEILLHSLSQIQSDIFCLNETKIDTRQSQVQFELRDRAKCLDKHLHINMNSSKQPPATPMSIFKPGGTMVGTRGNWSRRIKHLNNDPAQDKLGRWSAVNLRGKNNTIITILSIYQVCKRGYEGENTAYLQQQADIYNAKGRYLDPRNDMCKDLKKALHYLNENSHKVIICADINDDTGHEFTHQWNNIMEEAGMRHVLQSVHNQRSLPRTYDRGVRCLDSIMVSENIQNEHIQGAGILPFYSITVSDHRALYIDIDVQSLFNDTTIDTTKHTYQRFTTKNVKKSEIYLNQLTNLMSKARLFQKTNDVKRDIQQLLLGLKSSGRYIGNETEAQTKVKLELHQRIQRLDTKRCQLMIAAEKKCGTKKADGMFWYSTALRVAA